MILTCNECEWSFRINSNLIKSDGSRVRCSKCGNIWTVYPELNETEPSPEAEVPTLETAEDEYGRSEEDGSGDPAFETADTGVGEDWQDMQEDIPTDVTDLPDLNMDPDLENDEDDLPNFEELVDIDDASMTEPGFCNGDEESIDIVFQDKGEDDCIDLTDLEDLVDSGNLATTAWSNESDDRPPELDPIFIAEGEETPESVEAGGVPDDADQIDLSDPGDIIEDESDPLLPADPADGEAQDLILTIDADLDAGEASEPATAKTADDERVDIDNLVENEPDMSVTSEDSDQPDERESGPEKELTDNDAELVIFLSSDNGPDKAPGRQIDDLPQCESDNIAAANGTDPIAEDPGTEDFSDTSDPTGQTHGLEDETERTKPQIGTTRTSRRVLALVSILFLALGTFIIASVNRGKFRFFENLDIRVPSIGSFFNSSDPDAAGNIRIIPLEHSVRGTFIDNPNAGKLFVVSGQVRNDYDHPRSSIRVTGKLYTRDNIAVRTATVLCGRLFSDKELSLLDIATIDRRLAHRDFQRKDDLTVDKGALARFMIVFYHLPDNLDEYSVQVAASSKS